MVQNASNILEVLQRDRQVLRKLGITRLAIFGSAVRGQHRDDSDLDFLVDLKPKTFDRYMDVKEHLESRFGCPIDLVLTSALKPELRDEILREAIDVPLG